MNNQNIALLLDLDNIKPKLNELELICQRHGRIAARRAFSNTATVLTAYGSRFRELGYRFEITPGLEIVSQEVDNLIFKATEELLQNTTLNIQLVAVVSNDNDYAKLFTKLKNRGIQTLAIGLGNQMGNQLRETSDYQEFLDGVINPMYIGIDLGTTNTVMALASQNNLMKQWVSSVVEVPIKDEQGALIQSSMIPSSVRFISHNNSEIGKHVKSQAYPYRDQTILAWKHDMGCSNNGRAFQYVLSTGNIAPEQAASRILEFCRQKLLERYGDLQGAVITHPACYEIDAIEATRKAAVLAGWPEDNVVLISEPQAALYDFLYQVQQGYRYVPFDVREPVNILVYDLGGGTLDVTLHEVQWNHEKSRFIINDLAIGSRTRIGGDVVDNLIAASILNSHQDYPKLSEAEQNKLQYELPIYAEKFKKLWGSEYQQSQDKQNFNYAFQGLFLDAKFPIRKYISSNKMREILASILCEDLSLDILEDLEPEIAFNSSPFTDRMNTLVVPILEVLLKAKQTQGEIPPVDGILLNGGMTYFPLIRERLIKLFPSVPILDDSNPDLAVARGASLYAAGVIKPKETINPTNLSLEVTENNEVALRTLIAQGQKYPYETVLSGFKLPETTTGYLLFKIWTGMGNKPNVNTSLQRLRQVAVDDILANQIAAGSDLYLQVKYTFDERLLLTLVSKDNPAISFKLEIATDTRDSIATNLVISDDPSIDIKNIIPSIPRTRHNQETIATATKITIEQWENLANGLHHNFSDARLHDIRRDLERDTSFAINRLNIADDLLRWFEIYELGFGQQKPVKLFLAAQGLTKIFERCDPEDSKVIPLERKYKEWIKDKLVNGLNIVNNSNLSNQLLVEIVGAPGKLIWGEFSELLMRGFERYKSQPRAVDFLNSLGKCGKLDHKLLSLLTKTIKDSPHLSHREKSFWALGRLISPGQPENWRVNFNTVLSIAELTIDQLYTRVTEPQILPNLTGCLSQCLAWQAIGYSFTDSFLSKIRNLPNATLPVYPNLSRFQTIANVFEIRLQLLPKMTNLTLATEAEIQQIQTFLMESIKE
jgi:molecular chaperone DnaK (HSP70)